MGIMFWLGVAFAVVALLALLGRAMRNGRGGADTGHGGGSDGHSSHCDSDGGGCDGGDGGGGGD